MLVAPQHKKSVSLLEVLIPVATSSTDEPDGAMQLERLPYMVQGVWSENLEQQIDATTQFRKLLSIGMPDQTPFELRYCLA